jgi:hypothetical protein
MGLYQIKKLLHRKVNNYQQKRQPTEWQKIFASYSFVKKLISILYEELKN